MNALTGGLVICALCAVFSGCSWMGKTAGKVQGKIERGVEDLEKGYEAGYKQESTKSRAAGSAPESSVKPAADSSAAKTPEATSASE